MSGPLPNRKHEICAVEWATGAPLLDGYLAGGYKPGYSARFNASRLRNMPHVRARMDELFRESAKNAIVGIGWVQRKLIDIAEGREPAKIKTHSDGKQVVERDKLAALVALARTLGINDMNVSATAIAGASAAIDGAGDLAIAQRIAVMLDRGEAELDRQEAEAAAANAQAEFAFSSESAID